MSYGIEVRNAFNQVVFSMDGEGGLLVAVFDVPASGGNVVQTYPALAGKVLLPTPVGQSPTYGETGANISLCESVVDYALGYPRVTATPRGRASTVYVFTQ